MVLLKSAEIGPNIFHHFIEMPGLGELCGNCFKNYECSSKLTNESHK